MGKLLGLNVLVVDEDGYRHLEAGTEVWAEDAALILNPEVWAEEKDRAAARKAAAKRAEPAPIAPAAVPPVPAGEGAGGGRGSSSPASGASGAST